MDRSKFFFVNKLILSCALCLLSLSSPAANTNTMITVSWEWPFPIDLGGLSKADYATNVVWQFYAGTNVAGPYTNAMTVYPTNVFFDGNVSFATIIPATNQLSFFKLTVVTPGGESGFSNVLPLLPVPATGRLTGAKGR